MNIMKRIFSSLLVCMLLLLCLAPAAFADEITADSAYIDITGKTGPFIFHSDHMETGSDLFGNFKNVFPGDTITQEIRITHKALGFNKLKLFIRAVPHSTANLPQANVLEHEQSVERMNDFLSKLHLKLWLGRDLTKTPIFDSAASESGNLTDFFLMGVFSKGRTGYITAQLEVPIDLGNEYMDRMGEVDWEFMIEEVPNPIIPQTGDQSNVHVMIAVSLLSLAAIVVVVIVLLKKKKK